MMWQVCWTIFFSSQLDLLSILYILPNFLVKRYKGGKIIILKNLSSSFMRLASGYLNTQYVFQGWIFCLNFDCHAAVSSAKVVSNYVVHKGQLNSEWIYEVIISPKMPTKNLKDFCPGSLLLLWQKSFKFLVGILGETMTS